MLVPALFTLDVERPRRFEDCEADVLFGPRSGSRTPDFSMPHNLSPGCLQQAIAVKVLAVDSIRAGDEIAFSYAGEEFAASHWLESIESDLEPSAVTADGHGVYFEHDRFHYLGAVTCGTFLRRIVGELCGRAGVAVTSLDGDLRLRRRDEQVFVFNYGPDVDRHRHLMETR